MLDASADADEVHAGAVGSFVIYPAVADVHGARSFDCGAIEA